MIPEKMHFFVLYKFAYVLVKSCHFSGNVFLKDKRFRFKVSSKLANVILKTFCESLNRKHPNATAEFFISS